MKTKGILELTFGEGSMMIENLKEKIKERIPIIFVVVMVIYLSALAAKTGMVYWDEFQKKDTSAQTTVQNPG